jgi:photosystem II stability/assembly factor-like uncharacterized protein
MKKITYFLLPLLLIACGKQDAQDNSEGNNSRKIDRLMMDGNPLEPGSRDAWNLERLADPQTGLIPPNMRRRELEFAATLPANYERSFSWDQRGPTNVGGRTRAIAFDVLDENIWFAGSVTGGIWRSADAGLSWAKVTDNLDAHSITSIVQDTRPGNENVWYAGTGEKYGVNSQTSFEALFSGNGVLKSTDGGLTWSVLPSSQSDTPTTYLSNGDMDFVWRMVIDPSDLVNDVVLAAVYNGVMRSDDGGTTWSQVLGFTAGGFSNPGSQNLDLVVSPSGVFYCTMSSDGPDKGVYRSDDGITWTNIIAGFFPAAYGRLTMTFNPLDENILWMFGAGSTGEANGHALYRYEYVSGDGAGAGGVWSDRSPNLPDQSCLTPGINTNFAQLTTQSSFDVHMAIHPTDTSVMYIAGTSIWRNKDAFTSDTSNQWIGGYRCETLSLDSIDFDYQYENHHPDQHYLTFLPSDSSILVNSNDGGVFKTVDNLADSVAWVPMNNGYITTQPYAVMIEPGVTTSHILFAGFQDNGTWWTKTAEVDTAWKSIALGDGMYGAVTNGLDYYMTCSQRGRMYLKQIDTNGIVYAQERLDPENGPSTYNWANSLRLDPTNDKRLFWNGRTYLWRLDNLQNVPLNFDMQNKEPNYWVKIDSSYIGLPAGYITDIEMCESDSGKVWYGSSNGKLYRLDNAYAVLPASPSQVELTGADFPAGSYISSVAVDPFDSDDIVVTFANYNVPSIFRTDDGGVTWQDISGNLEENQDGTGDGPAVFWTENYIDGTIFVGTSTGLYTTSFPDSTNTVWTFEPSIGNVPVDHMDYRTFDGYFAVATHGLGVFTTHLAGGFLGMEKEEEVGLSVYPTLSTEIVNIIVPESAKNLEIYNLSGQKVYQEKLSGNAQVDISNFQSGAYIIVVRSGDQKWTEKFIKN